MLLRARQAPCSSSVFYKPRVVSVRVTHGTAACGSCAPVAVGAGRRIISQSSSAGLRPGAVSVVALTALDLAYNQQPWAPESSQARPFFRRLPSAPFRLQFLNNSTSIST